MAFSSASRAPTPADTAAGWISLIAGALPFVKMNSVNRTPKWIMRSMMTDFVVIPGGRQLSPPQTGHKRACRRNLFDLTRFTLFLQLPAFVLVTARSGEAAGGGVWPPLIPHRCIPLSL